MDCKLRAKNCGGCPLLGLDYAEQLKQKEEKVRALVGKYGPVHPIRGMEQPYHYRNKVISTFAPGFGGKLTSGIYAANSHKVLPVESCLLQDEVLDKTMQAVRAAAKATGGLILLLVVLGPLAGLELSDLALRYQDLSRDMERQAEAYRQEGQAQLELGIQQRTAAYISEKAAQLGLSCCPRVETAWRDGVPYPSGVTLDIAENQALAEVLTDELGIPPSQQHWLG